MKPLHLPKNVKVHFAGAEVQSLYLAPQQLGVSYSLYTCYPWVERKVFGKAKSPIIPLRWQKEDSARLVPKHIADVSLHSIQDSGLFTLMFGSQKEAKKDSALINRWYDGLVEFTLNHGQPVTCVEVDCQKVLGVDAAWDFRQRMKRDLPNNRIINVFHLEDGQKGLDRLIEFSEYIAISVPELRFAGKKNLVPYLARYIKRKKPSIDLHLLGCTELALLKECSFATSSDSTTWVCAKKFGFINGRHITTLDTAAVRELIGPEKWDIIHEYSDEKGTNCLSVNVEILKEKYERACGPQDYYKAIPSRAVLPLSTTRADNV